MLAPIVLFVYNRADHARKTLEALARNNLSQQSELFVFSDGAKREEEQYEVDMVRQCLQEYKERNYFKSFEVVEAPTNKGLARSVIEGVSEIIERYGKVIVLEDDLITGPDFLDYMNKGLDFYEKEENIWSISGYSFPIRLLKLYPHDIYYSYRGCSCGWATWSDRWKLVDWNVSDYNEFLRDCEWQKRFCKGGRDLPETLSRHMKGEVDSWAIRWVFEQSNQGKYTIYPKKSRLYNIGFDGTGTHSGINQDFDTDISCATDKVKFEFLKPQGWITYLFRRKYEDTIEKKISRNINKLIKKM